MITYKRIYIIYLILVQFFRSPHQPIPTQDDALLYSPADGKVVAIEEIEETEYFQDKRLQKAMELLQEGSLKPSDIYLDIGYNNLSNFSTAFKNKFGKSPKDI